MSQAAPGHGVSPTVLVSGHPRSGTSLMMQILQRAGLSLLCDDERPPDAFNPRGYFEFSPVKATLRDASWVERASGRAVKVILALLPGLPTDRSYRVLLMRRAIEEVVASQNAMLAELGESPSALSNTRLAEILTRQLEDTRRLLDETPCFEWLEVDYAELVRAPEAVIPRIAAFLSLDAPLAPIVACVESDLQRQRFSQTPGQDSEPPGGK